VRVSLSDLAIAETVVLLDPSRNHASHELSQKPDDERT